MRYMTVPEREAEERRWWKELRIRAYVRSVLREQPKEPLSLDAWRPWLGVEHGHPKS